MAFNEEEIDLALNDSLPTFDALENFVLKSEQQDAIRQLARNKDVLAVLTTGFGKSMIFRFGVRVKQLLTKEFTWNSNYYLAIHHSCHAFNL